MAYNDLLALRPRPVGRPANYRDLLLHPIHEDPSLGYADGWEKRHAVFRRFYVGGIDWFENNAGLNANQVAEHRNTALERFKELNQKRAINWRSIPGLQADKQRYWDGLARQQFNAAYGLSPMYLSKALLVMLTCEIAVEAALRQGKLPNIMAPFIRSPEDIYQRMAILPACWNVNRFRRLHGLLEKDPQALMELASACGQDEVEFLDELAKGSTVTFATASAIRKYCLDHQIDLGGDPKVREASGKYLGKSDASKSERVDCG